MPRFKPGESGNPKGRPRLDQTQCRLRDQIKTAAPGLVDSLITAALGGDVGAGKILLERVVPALRPLDSPIQIDLAGSPCEAAKKILAAVGVGQLTPDQSAKLLAGLGHLSHAIEVDEVVRRLEALEQQAHARQHASPPWRPWWGRPIGAVS